jgi:hypothetical protein
MGGGGVEMGSKPVKNAILLILINIIYLGIKR